MPTESANSLLGLLQTSFQSKLQNVLNTDNSTARKLTLSFSKYSFLSVHILTIIYYQNCILQYSKLNQYLVIRQHWNQRILLQLIHHSSDKVKSSERQQATLRFLDFVEHDKF
ncbi:hypothetical protein FGO68_gene17052 [Halteria grandinella]|uniref:Uncharacterized protein n=1 Tax=Halteria grandinella TaxID=5974 RepID=A0A8J8NFC4_HALGN|nr:hypothetical protein FGO68_gene17052 [Halteria grandinella]